MARGCARFHDDLSGFVDETLPAKRWAEVAQHLAGCPLCREETIELRDLRSALANAQAGASRCPSALASRLEAIAGEECSQPLYLSAAATGASCALPSRRRRRRNLMMRGTVAMLALVVGVGVLSVALAPAPRSISDAVGASREQFAMQMTATSVQGAVGAVLLAQQRGAQLATARNVGGVPVDEDQSLPISSDAAEAMLSTAAAAPVAVSGVQEVLVVADGGGFLRGDVTVQRVGGQGANLTVYDRLGNQFLSSFAPDFVTEITSSEHDSLDDWDFSAFASLATIAGRDASVMEARRDGALVARWWFDVPTGILLRSERFDSQGNPTIIVGFRSLRVGVAELSDQASEVVALSRVGSSGTRGWCVGLATCPSELAGLPLVAYSSTKVRGERSMSLIYSDGVQTLVATWSEGCLEQATRLSAAAAAGLPSVEVWQSGAGVVAVATNGSPAMQAQAVDALPGESACRTGLTHRLGAGFARLTGLR